VIREALGRNWRGLLWHAGVVLYGIAAALAAFDAPRTRIAALVWAGGAALLLVIPAFRSRWRSTLVAAAALPVMALALEAAVRARFVGADALLHPVRCQPDPGVFFDDMAVYVERGGAKIRTMSPEQSRWFKGVHLATNSLGYRGGEFSASAPECVRAVVLGDSFTMAWGVPENRSYARVLESLLRRRRPGKCFDVFNLGFPSEMIGPAGERLRVDGFPLDPDFVVLGISPRMVTAARTRRWGAAERDEVRPTFMGRIAEALLRGPREAPGSRPTSWIRQHAFAFQKRPRFDAWEDALVARKIIPPRHEPESELDEAAVRRDLLRLREVVRREPDGPEIPVVVAYLRPVRSLNEDSSSGTPAALRRLVEEAGFVFVDTGPSFPPESEAIDYVLFPGENHPNARAQSVYARAIAEAVAPERGRGILP
jgi:hypothetical protein